MALLCKTLPGASTLRINDIVQPSKLSIPAPHKLDIGTLAPPFPCCLVQHGAAHGELQSRVIYWASGLGFCSFCLEFKVNFSMKPRKFL